MCKFTRNIQAQQFDVEGCDAGFNVSPRKVSKNAELFEPTSLQYNTQGTNQVQSGLGRYIYQEFDGAGLDAEKLVNAIDVLVGQLPEPILRLFDDEKQALLPNKQWGELALHDLRSASIEESEVHLKIIRMQYGKQVPSSFCDKYFYFQLSLLPHGRHRLHMSFNQIAGHTVNFSLVFDELAALVLGESLSDLNKDYSFRRYLIESEVVGEAAREQARQFWMERLSQLPAIPQLPLANDIGQVKQTQIFRRRTEIQSEEWSRFKANANMYGVSPSIALATCFGAVIARWSSQPRMLLSVMCNDRLSLPPANKTTLADFTNYLLLDIVGQGENFHVLAKANQQAYNHAHEKRHWVDTELLQYLHTTTTGTPTIFSTNFGCSLFSHKIQQTLGTPGWEISYAPHTGINHLTYEQGDLVVLQWDSNDALFPCGLIEAMFKAYEDLVRHLAACAKAWREHIPELMPTEQRLLRESINTSENELLPEGLLHDNFFRKASTCPDAAALIHGDQHLSYGQLAEKARRCAGALVAHGVKPGDTVAISMPKGIGQIIAVLGILYVGAVYVPVSLDQPRERRDVIYCEARTALVLTCKDAPKDGVDCAQNNQNILCWQDAVKHPPLSRQSMADSDQPAYIIYTSGSTGTPKGVCISHRGALNTCEELNRRYAVGSSDRVLALSGLHFDLSVYDIFGLLSTGGALVLVDEEQRRDPSIWCKVIEQHRVTLWNTVPALFDMLLTYCEAFKKRMPEALRVVLTSGDWIGLDLPARYRDFRPDGKFVAMGGATEASIWSNAYDVDKVEPDWRSIPYGYPLARQKYRVVDSQGLDCPDWVAGELWIGGAGVALGYFNDPERTAQQFVTVKGERWYRTGDIGRYWSDGRLEFLGRRDKQVKIGGYRIELGEIEAALYRVDGVKNAVALAIGEREKSLVAFVVLEGTALGAHHLTEPAPSADRALPHKLDKVEVIAALRKQLPLYMIPQRLFLLETLPLTANGKVDHNALMLHCAPFSREAVAKRLSDGDAHG